MSDCGHGWHNDADCDVCRPPAVVVAGMRSRITDLERENDVLRKRLAVSNADCPYCGLPAADMAQCAHGFPGCGRADDIMIETDH